MDRLLNRQEYFEALQKGSVRLSYPPITTTYAEAAVMQAQDAKTARQVAEEIFAELEREGLLKFDCFKSDLSTEDVNISEFRFPKKYLVLRAK